MAVCGSVVTCNLIQEAESADTKISVLPSSQCFQLPTICDNQSSSLASGLGNGLHIQYTVHSRDVLNVQYTLCTVGRLYIFSTLCTQ